MTESLGKFYSMTNNLSGIKNEKTLLHLVRIEKENSLFLASRINKRKGGEYKIMIADIRNEEKGNTSTPSATLHV